MMEWNPEIHTKFMELEWFRLCGTEQYGEFTFPALRVSNISEAIIGARSESWADARTEAQGDLTGYLAKNHAESYGGHWNRLAYAVEARIRDEVMPTVRRALGGMGAAELSDTVLLDLTRIVLWSVYSRRFRRVPDFFGKLLAIYERGHLPCGWSGSLALWPKGQLVVY